MNELVPWLMAVERKANEAYTRAGDYFDLNQKLLSFLTSISNLIDSKTITEQTLLYQIASAEFSEWNDIFLFVVNALKIPTTVVLFLHKY